MPVHSGSDLCIFARNFALFLCGLLSSPALVDGEVVDNRNLKPTKMELENSMFSVDMIVGEESGDDRYMFGDVRGICVGDDNAIRILDRGMHRIQVYGPDGNFLSSMGQEGEGPCDLRYPTALCVDVNLNAYVADQSRVMVFENNGRCRSFNYEIEGGALPKSITIGRDGSLYVACYDVFNETIIHVYSNDGKKIRSFCDPYSRGEDSDARVQTMLAGGRLTLDRSGDIWFSQFMPYELRKYSPDGLLALTVNRPNDFMKIPKEEVSGGQLKVPHSPYASGVFQFSNGTIMNVVTVQSDVKDGPALIVDLFTEEGLLQESQQIAGDISVYCVDGSDAIYLLDKREFPRVLRARLVGGNDQN